MYSEIVSSEIVYSEIVSSGIVSSEIVSSEIVSSEICCSSVKYPLHCEQATPALSPRHTEQSSWFTNGQWDGRLSCFAVLQLCNKEVSQYSAILQLQNILKPFLTLNKALGLPMDNGMGASIACFVVLQCCRIHTHIVWLCNIAACNILKPNFTNCFIMDDGMGGCVSV